MAIQEVIAIFQAKVQGAKDVENLGKSMDSSKKKAGDLLDKLKDFAKGAAIVGAFYSMKSFTDQTALAADTVGKLALKLGITTDELEGLNYSAQLNGTTAENMTAGLKVLARNLDAASQGAGMQRDALNELGLSMDDLQGTTMDEKFALIGEGLKKIPDNVKKMGVVMNLFGRQGVELIPTLENMKASMQEFKDLQGGFTSEGTARAAEYQDSVLRINSVITRLKNTILIAIAPAFVWLNDKIKIAIQAVNRITQGSHIFDIGLIALLGTLGVLSAMLVTKVAPALMTTMLPMLKWIVIIAALILILDDFWAWWEGRPSAFGAILESMFGKGASQKFREWMAGFIAGAKETLKALLEMSIWITLSLVDIGVSAVQGIYKIVKSIMDAISKSISWVVSKSVSGIIALKKAYSAVTGDAVDLAGLQEIKDVNDRASQIIDENSDKSLPFADFRKDLQGAMDLAKTKYTEHAYSIDAKAGAAKAAMQDNRTQNVTVNVQGATDPAGTARAVTGALGNLLDTKQMKAGVPSS